MFNFENEEIFWVGNPTNMPVKICAQMQQTYREWVPQDQTQTEAPAFGYSSQNFNTIAITIEGTDAQTILSEEMKRVQDSIARMNNAFQNFFYVVNQSLQEIITSFQKINKAYLNQGSPKMSPKMMV